MDPYWMIGYEYEPNAGAVTFINQSPDFQWNYSVAYPEEGEGEGKGRIAEWSYTGATITGASVDGGAAADGWDCCVMDATSVVFGMDTWDPDVHTPLGSGSQTGFHITGTSGGTGSWVCGENSGSGLDGPLPVILTCFSATSDEGKVVLRWTTESEIDNLGFYVYRALAEDGEYERLTAELIEGAGNSAVKQEYSFADVRLTNGITYWYKLEDVAFDGTTTMHGPISVIPQAEEAVEVQTLPMEFALSQNVPNPFNPVTEIRYQLPEASYVELAIYDVLGQKVRVLVDGFVDASYRTMVWDARDVASGIYFVRMEAGDFLEVRKMVLIR